MSNTLLQVNRSHSIGHMINLRMARHLTHSASRHRSQRGHPMAIFANDLIGIQINQFGLYEREELHLMFEFLAPLLPVFAKGMALDIGANIGNHALFFAQRFQQVHAFEPNPYTFDLLRFNAQWAPNVQIHRHGLGDARGVFELIEHSTNLGGSSILIGDKGSNSVVPIDVETLDATTIDTTELCFMKIDVEGFETQVIRGGLATLKQRQPLVVLEQHASEFVDGSSPALNLLASLGYRFCWEDSPPLARTWLGRRIDDLRRVAFGVQRSIVTGDQVPGTNHSMLVAVPERFQAVLGLVKSGQQARLP